MIRFAQPVMRNLLKRQFEQHCTNLKAVREDGTGSRGP